MKKNYLFIGAAAIMMAGCASDDLVGDGNISNGETPIAFSMNTPNATRADKEDGDAATALGKEFIVWGEKTTGTEDGNAASDANLVFKNYRVQYTASTANTTVSNTDDWEYVGITPYKASTETTTTEAFVSPSIWTSAETKQTIKYWDDNANSYTFTAVSAKQEDITGHKVLITKNTSGSSASEKGYKIELASGATVGDIYVADRNVIGKTNGNFSHSAVKMSFRNFQSKIRFGIYETVPGYKVVITGIKYTTKPADTQTTTATVETHTASGNTKTFGIEGNFVLVGKSEDSTGKNTSYTVTYDANNHAQVSVTAGNSQCYMETAGTNWLSTTKDTPVGTAANAPTWDNVTTTTTTTGEGEGQTQTTTTTVNYTAILPNPSNETNLKLQVAYKLISEDTGEEISFKEGNNEIYRTVEVPAQYCQWKSNYAYTYLFKITDKSADLYPITFDACVVTEETGNQETITEVVKPSITTFATTSSSDKTIVKSTVQNEYTASNVIYATVVDGSSLATLTDSNIKLYTVTATGTQTISEASVANCLAKGKKNEESNPTTWTATAGTNNVLTVTAKTYTAGTDLLNVVPSEDGNTVTLDETDKKAIMWTAESGKTYAIEYKDSSNNLYYKIVKIGN